MQHERGGLLYVDDDPVFCSAGTAAGIDTRLHILRRDGVPPHRDGGQTRYATHAVPAVDDTSRLRDTLAWAQDNLATDLNVDQLAARALRSPHSFARHFRAATGSTPHAWLLAQRVAQAQQLLESTDFPIDEVAQRSGMGAATTLRHHFMLRVGTSPQAYRRAFRGPVRLPSAG